MSNEVTALVKKRRVGSPTRKCVLMYFADCASDDGTGIWTSKSNVAADLEMSKRTVQNCVEDLIGSGLVREVGQRKCAHGFTVEYCLDLAALQNLSSTRDRNESAPEKAGEKDPELTGAGDSRAQEIHPAGAGDSPHRVQDVHPNHTGTIQEYYVRDGHEQTNSAFEKFWETFPRPRNRERCLELFGQTVSEGVSPEWIVTSAGRYRDEQRTNSRMYLVYADNWLAARRWEDFTDPNASKTSTGGTETTLRLFAKKINEGGYLAPTALSHAQVAEILERGLSSKEALSAAGFQP